MSNRLHELRAIELVELDLLGSEAVRGGADRRQRRAKVVGDRLQHRRLDRVAPSQRIGFDRLVRQPLPVDGDLDEGGQGGKEPASLGDVGRLAFGNVQRADQALVDLQRMWRLACRRCVPTELDSRPGDAEHVRGANRDRLELGSKVLTTEQVGGDVGEEGRLALTLLGLCRPPADAVGEQAHRDRHHDVRGERKPVRSVRKRETVQGRQVEPVEREHACDRDRDRVSHPPERGDDDHREDVEDPEAEDGDERLEELDRGGDVNCALTRSNSAA